MDNKTVCISIEGLYDAFGESLMFGKIRKTRQDNVVYFDYFDLKYTLVCMDGEEVEVIRDCGDILFLSNKNGEKNCTFALTKKEFDIAIGGQNNG
jgi:hypothetical protein